ncbi:MAG: hypothetical protein AAFN07_03920 [Pseudomonadota bacterium]
MSTQESAVKDRWLQVVRCTGSDRTTFLQGQLTQDVQRLDEATPALPAACCDPKGRVIATITLVWLPDEILMLVHHELAQPLIEHLSRYRLRANVQFEVAQDFAVAPTLARHTGHEIALWRKEENGWRIGVMHEQIVAAEDADQHSGIDESRWRKLRLVAGVLDLPSASSAQFTAHMLNLDKIGAISFNKGCYTGQEIVARTEHRGTVKRRARLLRLVDRTPKAVDAGQSITIDGRKVGTVVVAADATIAAVCGEITHADRLKLDDGRSVSFID